MKALIIDEPWIGLILRGEKTWEMRKTGCSHRGLIGLIRKGSGQVVGTAEVTGSLQPLTDAEAYRAAFPKHRIPDSRQGQALADGWNTPWVIAGARALDKPVPYRHPNGAVIWVLLEPDVTARIARQNDAAEISTPDRVNARPVSPAPIGRVLSEFHPVTNHPSAPGAVRDVIVTGGNRRNNHLYLPLDFFPAECVGGSNKDQVASKKLTVMFSPGTTISTDIDGSKKILRSRAEMGDFFERSGTKEGDVIRITRVGPYAYRFDRLSPA